MGKVKNTSRGSVRLYKDPETKVAGRVNLWMEVCMDSLMGEGRDLSHIVSEQRGGLLKWGTLKKFGPIGMALYRTALQGSEQLIL